MTPDELIARFTAGDRRACGQVMSRVENDAPDAPALLHRLYPLTGRGYKVGITGPPGAGKSSLVEKLALACRARGRSVGIIAVDPTSPFSGGAILGDRVRMSSLFLDPGVFIRSMASRGSLGGLALKTRAVSDVMDAFGKEFIIIETIGVGQVELDIAGAAGTTVVVLVPESGDSIQAMKAGLMEVGDLFAVNKSDREGADRMAMEIEGVLELRNRNDNWRPEVIQTVATRGTGVTELLDGIDRHRAYLTESHELERRRRDTLQREIRELVESRVHVRLWSAPAVKEAIGHWLEIVADRRATPWQAADEILRAWQCQGGKIER